MLSYRHSFHAGNFADVLKHLVLVEVVEYLLRKDGRVDYIDTHAGAGLFNLAAGDALKLQEHSDGIGRLGSTDIPGLARYLEVIDAFNSGGGRAIYPGSPAIALHLLRPQDRAWLFELHPQDFDVLAGNMAGDRRVRVAREDGLRASLALLPPVGRRALVFIDPSYEIKADYDQVVDTVQKAHAKFATGTYVIWYPVVDRRRIIAMERRLLRTGIRNIQRFEICVGADSDDHGMTGSGLFVINPPWTLLGTMSTVLPDLARVLARDPHFSCACDVIAGE